MTLSEKYDLIRELGHGASGNVYLVKHRTLNLLRAVKIISKDSANAGHILQEALIIKNLKYQGIPIIYDIDETQDSYYIYEEYIEGITLTEYINAHAASLTDIIIIVSELCNIIDYLHHHERGILHLDIKPDNIIIDNNNRLWLIDYDNAITIGETTSVPRGSEGFAPPQAYWGNKPDVTWDIYSLGMIIMYMSEGTIHSNLCDMHNQQLTPIVRKCVHHNPILRYRSVATLRKDLQKIINKKSDVSTDNKSLEINVGGTDRGVGTTHFCLCLCSFFNRNGIPAVVVNANRTDSYSRLCSIAANNNSVHNNIFSLGNINIVNTRLITFSNNLENYRVIIYDYGDYSVPQGLDILVCSSLKPFCELNLTEICHKDKLFLVWNLCDTKFFYDNTKDLNNSIFNYRMPCVYDYNEEFDLSRSMFEELLTDMNTGFSLSKSCHKTKLKGRKSLADYGLFKMLRQLFVGK